MTKTSSALTRRETLLALGAGTAFLALPRCSARLATAAAPQPRNGGSDAAALLDEMAWNLLAHDPEQATSKGVDTGVHAGLRSKLADRSQAGREALAATLRRDLARLSALDPAPLDPVARTTAEVVTSAYRTALDGFALPYGDVAVGGWRNTPYPVIQNVGEYLDAPNLLDADHPVRDATGAEAYLSRLAAIPHNLDGETDRIRSARAMGLVPPSFLLDRTIAQLSQSIADARGGGALVASLTRRTTTIPGNWDARARAIVTSQVVPALERQLTEIRAERAVATDVAGMWSRPHGDEFYSWALRADTTTRRTADEIHALGREELAALQAKMDPILRGLGFTTGTVGERMAALGKDPRFKFPASDAGRAQIVALMQQKLDYIRTRLPVAFRTLVRGNLEIRRIAPAEEAGAPGAYGGPGSIDGKIPGKIWINLGDTDRHSKFSLPTLAFHEGIPGHVWQGEYANKLPLIRSLLGFSAYTEGWALYAETLGDELGAYEGDPVGQLGYLQSIAFRACRMVVDTGLHAKRWTRAQAIEWFSTTNGSGLSEVTPEVDRYCSWPGQACAYKMGHSEILRQRERAKLALGARYDLRDFDQAVVDGGNVPLDVLAHNVNRYIASARG
ncbi:DUF885 domain-containing protein [Novosphingobium tardum]|uniref:DUF885 domain-containing protein n=1 Tax=Novosphingobium tardum TaxID=1538021 RepID=A0ABV8RRC1_9SPHN